MNASRPTRTVPLALRESTSQHINIPHCAAQTIEIKVIESKEAMLCEDCKESEERELKENISLEVMEQSPSFDETELNSEILCDYGASASPFSLAPSNASPDFESSDPNSNSSHSALSFDEITKMMGADTFASEFGDNLFREEQGRAVPWYSARNRMPSRRREMVDWIRTAAFKYHFSDSTQFRALFFFDRLCSLKDIRVVSKDIRIAAAVCLFIAAKYNEVDSNVPRLGRFCGRHFDVDAMVKTEIRVLDAFAFELKTVLSIDFVLLWIEHQRIVFADDRIDGVRATQSQCAKSLERFAVFFLNIASSDASFWAFPASVLAAAVICAARRVLRIAPYWNRKLSNVVRHSPRGLEKCFSALWAQYAQRFPSKCAVYTAAQPRTMADFI